MGQSDFNGGISSDDADDAFENHEQSQKLNNIEMVLIVKVLRLN